MSEESTGDLEKALLRNPFDGDTRCRYAQALYRAGAISEARQQFELALKSDPEMAAAMTGLARCAHAGGDQKTALDHYLRARNLNGFRPEAELEKLVEKSRAQRPALSLIGGGAKKVTALHANTSGAVRFVDVVGMEQLKKTLRLQIIEPFRNPGVFQRFRKKSGGGVMLYGPPGCGKTMIARAIATECGAEFESVGISDVLNMWIGESERNLADLFEKARSRRPCVLFFDELDALAYSRSKASSGAARTVVNEFLAQLDGFADDNEGLLVLAATNMPWDVDPAMLRPGRFSRQVFVPPPDATARRQIIELRLQDIPCADIDSDIIAARTEFFSGADIDGLLDIAKETVIADILDSGTERELLTADLMDALDVITPSTLDWLKTARNLVKFAGADHSYKDVEKYLKKVRRI
jgi:SpoVK/Ycf46/Vps4 family AAA+-type ATPase